MAIYEYFSQMFLINVKDNVESKNPTVGTIAFIHGSTFSTSPKYAARVKYVKTAMAIFRTQLVSHAFSFSTFWLRASILAILDRSSELVI